MTPCPDVFVGRARPLALLEKALEQSSVASRSLLVSGEAGIGKTALIREFVSRAEARSIRVAWGHCYDVAGVPPYLPFQQVAERLRVDFARLSEPLFDESDAGGPPARRRRGAPEAWRQQFLTRVTSRLQNMAASQPLILIVEDIQWADISSLLLLNTLVDTGGRGLLLVSTIRPEEPVEGARQRLIYRLQLKSARLRLPGLTIDEIRNLVSRLYGPGLATAREVRFLHRFTRGNPLFVTQTLDHLKSEGALQVDNIERAIARTRIPVWLGGLLDVRLAALPAPVLEVLSAASVLGDEFSLDVLSALTEEPAAAVEDLIDVAIQRGILRAAVGTGGPRFAFAHALYRKRLCESLRPSLRRAYHARVARAGLAREIELPVEEQAAHAALAGERALKSRAVTFCRAAAAKAERVCAYEAAASFWELAVQSASPRRRRDRADLLARLGWACWAAREWQRARRAWKEAVALYEELHESQSLAALALALGETARWQQDVGEAEDWLRRAIPLLPSGSEARLQALAMLGSLECLRNQPTKGMAILEQVRQDRTVQVDPYTLYWLSYGYLTLGDVETARVVAEKAFALAQDADDHYTGSFLAAHLTHIYLSFMRAHSASRCVAFLQQAVEPSNTMGLSFLLISRSLLAAYRGQWTRVIRVCDRTMGELRLAGRYQFAASHYFRAEARHALGETEAACAEMAQALPDLAEMRPAAAMYLARALLRLGDLAMARRLLRRFAPPLLSTRRMAAGRAILGEVSAWLGERALAEQVYQLLADEQRPLLLLYSAVSVQRILGVVASHLEDWPRAIQHFETAIKQLAAGGVLGELLPTYLDYARMRRARRRRGDLTKALALEARAAQLREQLGMPAPAPAARGSSAVGDGTCGNRFGLTGRELQVLRLVAEGRRNAEIAEALSISDRTVERHLENIMNKMGVGGRVEAVVAALQEGLAGKLVPATVADEPSAV
jgi:DNA-binding CsgD family transcriptional regulator